MATIAENLSRIQSAKTDIKTAIEAKGVTVPSSATIDTYATYVSQISGGDDSTLKGIIDRSLTSIDIPSGLTIIGAFALTYCSSLSSVTIPNTVTLIAEAAFRGCSSISSITIPSGVTTIQGAAFYQCTSLTSINIPDSVTYIGNYDVFARCTNLTSVTIGSGVTNIGNRTFQYCSGLTSVTIHATTPPTLGSNVFDNTNDCPIYVPSASVEAYKAANNWSTYASRIQAIPNS